MLANVAVDFAIGSIPIIGDAFDLWFKANARNVRLIRGYTAAPQESTVGAWAFFMALLAGFILLAVGAVWVLTQLLGAIFG
jgi:uncharacterized iron-regulated membrane protein